MATTTAQETFYNVKAEAIAKLDALKAIIAQLDEEQKSYPRNWGYAGSVGYINEELGKITASFIPTS